VALLVIVLLSVPVGGGRECRWWLQSNPKKPTTVEVGKYNISALDNYRFRSATWN